MIAERVLRVLTLVPPDAAAHLAAALDGAATVIPAREVAQLLGNMASAVPAAVLVDPRLVPPNQMETLIHAVRLSGAPLVAHTALTSFAMRALLAISAAGVREVLIRGVDDDPASVRRTLDRLTQETLGGRVLSRLTPALAAMPEPLRAAVTTMFVRPDAADTPQRLAARAGINRRSLDRWVARSGIVSARLLVAAPRLLIAYGQLRRPELSVANVAARAGYSSPRSLERQCEALLGVRPIALRERLEPEAFVHAVARGLLASRDAAADPGDRPPPHADEP